MNAQCPFHTAPCSIQRRISATWAGVSGLPAFGGGIRVSGSSEVIRSAELALVRLARDDDRRAVGRAEQSLAGVEPQVGLALVGVRPVALVARLGEDRPDVAVEVDVGPGRRRPAPMPPRPARSPQTARLVGRSDLIGSAPAPSFGGAAGQRSGSAGPEGLSGGERAGLSCFAGTSRARATRGRCRRGRSVRSRIRISWISGCFKCRIDRESATSRPGPPGSGTPQGGR